MASQRHAILSEDGRTLTIVTPTTDGTHKMTMVRGASDGPFTEDDIAQALNDGRPVVTKPGQRNITRRFNTPLGQVYLSVLTGPPTWLLPRGKVQRYGLLVGWLRLAVAAQFRRATAEDHPR